MRSPLIRKTTARPGLAAACWSSTSSAAVRATCSRPARAARGRAWTRTRRCSRSVPGGAAPHRPAPPSRAPASASRFSASSSVSARSRSARIAASARCRSSASACSSSDRIRDAGFGGDLLRLDARRHRFGAWAPLRLGSCRGDLRLEAPRAFRTKRLELGRKRAVRLPRASRGAHRPRRLDLCRERPLGLLPEVRRASSTAVSSFEASACSASSRAARRASARADSSRGPSASSAGGRRRSARLLQRPNRTRPRTPPVAASSASSGAAVQVVEWLDADCSDTTGIIGSPDRPSQDGDLRTTPSADNYLTPAAGGATMGGSRGRISFDGDTVSTDACRGPSPSLIRWKTNLTADTQLALAA